MILASGYKEPGEVRDFVLDFASEIGEDVIASFTSAVVDGTATITDTSEDGRSVTLTVDGGTAGEATTIRITLDTYGGLHVEGDLYVRVTSAVVPVNSYVTLTDADKYFAQRGNASWLAMTADARDAALIRATQYIDGRYRGQWQGLRTTVEQLLAWPRTGVKDEDGATIADDVIPRVVIYATCEAALREASSPGSLTPDMERETKRETVGPITVEYAAGGTTRPTIAAINDQLSSVLRSGSASGFINRA